MTAIGSGAIVAALFHVITYIQNVGNGAESSKTNKRGKHLKESSMGKAGVSRAGNVAYGKKGVNLHDRFRTLLEALELHGKFGNLEAESIWL